MSAPHPLECASGIRRSPLRVLARPKMPASQPLRGRSQAKPRLSGSILSFMSKCFGRSPVGADLEEDRLFFARSAPKLSETRKVMFCDRPRPWLDRNRVSSALRLGSEDWALETASIQTKPELRGVEEWAVKITLSSSVRGGGLRLI